MCYILQLQGESLIAYTKPSIFYSVFVRYFVCVVRYKIVFKGVLTYRTTSIRFFISVINQLDAQNVCFTTRLFHASTCFEHTYRCDDTRGCAMQFWPPDDEHMCSKHVDAWNKLVVKQTFCASSWLITEINILRCTVSETSKKEYQLVLIIVKNCKSTRVYSLYPITQPM